MADQLLPEAEQYTRRNNLRQIWRKFVRVMACIVVFCTTYALILPAITMEKDALCGLEEHTHSESCYTQVTSRQVTVLDCTYESLGVHSHTEQCRGADGVLICGLSDYVVHTHNAACADENGAVVCTLPEISGHVHAEACWQTPEAVLACGLEACEGHTHKEECWQAQEPVLTCGLEACEAHTHGAECLDADGTPVCGLEENAGHAHAEECWQTPEAVLACGQEEREGHTHAEACWQTSEPVMACGREEAVLHSHGEDCADENGTLTCTLTVLEQHLHGDLCFTTTEVAVDEQALTCGYEEHTHTDDCRGTGDNEETDPATGLTAQEQVSVDHVTALIDALPSASEIDAKLAEYEEAGDPDGEEAYYTAVSRQVAEVYSAYKLLPDELKSQVPNADKLLALEYIWSVTTLAVTTARPTIYQINSYDRSDGYFNGNSGLAVMLHGEGTVQSILGVPDSWIFKYWYAVFAEPKIENGRTYYKVSRIISPETNLLSYSPPENGYLFLFYNEQVIPDASVGDYVTIHFTVPSSGAEKSEGYGTVSFSTAASGIYSDAPTPIESASTRDFIEVNLYDYNGNINGNYWSDNNWYPGFQWNGGAYSKPGNRISNTSADLGVPNVITNRHVVDSIDFGNSLITNMRYGDDGGDGDYTKSVNATNVTKTSAYYLDKYGRLNWIYGNDTEGYTNKPVGSSTTDLSYNDVMYDTLINGYPAIADGTYLDYLFKDDTSKGSASAVTKLNTASIDGLFQYDSVSGKYYYNSRDNHAEYVSGENRFQLYEEILTPNFITYPFGNFLPLNTIADSGKATQVSAFNYSGGMRNYVERIIADLKNDAEGLGSYWVTSQDQLAVMLEEYKENWSYYGRTINSVWNTWTNLSAANAIRDYFWGDTDGDGDNPSDDVGFITGPYLAKMYNIDWDVQTNFFFGMEMKMRFYQPKGGMTGQDTNQDGTPDYPMKFNFVGDDDVWVYVDGVLFLDLTGIHRHVGGEIDFVNGKVHYYELVPTGGDIKSTPYKTFTFAEILTAAGKSTAGLNSKGTFADYSNHTFNFYFMERGSGSSVCRMEFNFPLLRQNTLSVEKELTADASIKALGNPDFRFQVLDVDDNGNKTTNSFFAQYDNVDEAGSQWAYSLYDTDGSVIQEIKVTKKNPDGSVHTLEVRNGAGELLRKEEQDANGNAVITDYPENGKVLTIDQYGVFTLKAGQRAEFTGISENWGKYYVRELIDPAVVEQFGTITVDGQTSSSVEGVTVNKQTFNGYDSPILDMSNGSTRFLFNNKITSAKLGKLTIKKILEAPYSGITDKTFRFSVTLNGAPLPAGTTYTVGSTTKTVVVEGGVSYVELQTGETALITNILAGTRFEVVEVLGLEDDYMVGYTVDGVDKEGSASGTIGVEQTVAVEVTNTERGTAVEIPVTKGYYYYGTVDRVSHFKLVRVTDATGMTTVGDPQTASMTVAKVAVTDDALFTLNYLEKELDFGSGDTLVYYYRLTEDNTQLPGSTLPNYQVFVYEVTLTKTADGVSSAVTGMWSGTADVDGTPTGTLTRQDSVTTATFMNTIYGPLTVSKLVDGSDGYKQREFTFEIILNSTYRGGAPLPDTLPAVITRSTGTEETTVTLTSTDGTETRKSCTVVLAHNESITIHQIPYQTTWSVTELNVPPDVEVSYVIYKGSTVAESASKDKPVGYVLVGEKNVAKVVVTNKEIYVLPETGGAGTNSYAMAGLMLMLCSAAFLLYRFTKRRREVT